MKQTNAVNTGSTIRTENLSITIPLEGYPLLQHMEILQEQHKILGKRIAELLEQTNGNKTVTPAATRKKEELKILEKKQQQIQSEFNSLVPYVQKYAKTLSDYADCKVIISHYCDIDKVREDLQKDINEYLDCTAHNFRVRQQNRWLKSLVKKI